MAKRSGISCRAEWPATRPQVWKVGGNFVEMRSIVIQPSGSQATSVRRDALVPWCPGVEAWRASGRSGRLRLEDRGIISGEKLRCRERALEAGAGAVVDQLHDDEIAVVEMLERRIVEI